MIKLGSRTEMILPAEGLQVDVSVGQQSAAAATWSLDMRRNRPS